MQRLKNDQKQKVSMFKQWTSTSDSVAISFLTKFCWNVEIATSKFFENPKLFEALSQDKQKIENFFNSYLDNRDHLGPGRMGPNGVQRLLNDLRFDPVDRKVLVLACKLKAETQCEFSIDEWINGMTAMKVDNLDALRERLISLNAEMDTDMKKFRDLYVFTFGYGKPASQRSLDMETAMAYWGVLFGKRFPIFGKWEEFLRSEHNSAITRDTWNLLLDFVQAIKPDLSDYDDDGAWPVLIDQFVEWARSKYSLPNPKAKSEETENYSSYY